jgi:hypothetical protein
VERQIEDEDGPGPIESVLLGRLIFSIWSFGNFLPVFLVGMSGFIVFLDGFVSMTFSFLYLFLCLDWKLLLTKTFWGDQEFLFFSRLVSKLFYFSLILS